MAANFELELTVDRWCEMQDVIQLNPLWRAPKVARIARVESWLWDAETELCAMEEVEPAVREGAIVFVWMDDANVGASGISVESTENGFCYSLWMTTEQYPELDCDWITAKNRDVYQAAYMAFLSLVSKYGLQSGMLALGAEMSLEDAQTAEEKILQSMNCTAWIVRGKLDLSMLRKRYQCCESSGECLTLLYKTEMKTDKMGR